MRTIDAISKIIQFGQPVLHTRDVAEILGISRQYASKLLSRLSHAQVIISLKRGLWLIDKTVNAYQLVSYLTAPFPSYLSLYTALYFHAMISQIPETIYVVTIARTQHLHNVLGDYSLHHVHPDFFFGFSVSPENQIPLATPEKALIDFLYFFPAKSKRFHSLPELTLPGHFDQKAAHQIIEKIPSKRTKTVVLNKLNKLMSAKKGQIFI